MSRCPQSIVSPRCFSAGWLGTYQGAVRIHHLDYYLDEFTFRFNRRTARHRGLVFFRLLQQAVATRQVTVDPLMGMHHNMLWSLE